MSQKDVTEKSLFPILGLVACSGIVELLPKGDTVITIFICIVIRPVVEFSKVEDVCDEYEKMQNIKHLSCSA
jgi:hypothetical protein